MLRCLYRIGRLPCGLSVLWLCASAALAAPEAYRLDTGASQVGFTYDLAGAPTRGVMPISAARLQIDVHDIRASVIDVTLNPRRAKAGIFVATEAMRGPQVLDARQFPQIRFQTREITGSLKGAQIRGDLTIRDVTRQVTLDARLFRQRGTAVTDVSQLEVVLSGEVDRHHFGATGFADLVGPTIRLRILARMIRID